MDVTRLVKILNLTVSDSDGEALTALRMATKIMREAGQTWESLLLGHQPSPADNGNPALYMLAYLLNHCALDEKTRKFVLSIERYFELRGGLTPRQFHTLRTTFKKHGGV